MNGFRDWRDVGARSLRQARSDAGASLVEYALLVALIALVCFGAVVFLGDATTDDFSRVGASVAAT